MNDDAGAPPIRRSFRDPAGHLVAAGGRIFRIVHQAGAASIDAVLNAPSDAEVEVGDVGTVVELLPPDGVEVEFLNRDGRTRCVTTLAAGDVLVLNRERTAVR